MRKVTFPFELDATEFCSDELRSKLIPVRDTLRDLHKDASDRERARKRTKMQPSSDDIAGGNAGPGGFGSGTAPVIITIKQAVFNVNQVFLGACRSRSCCHYDPRREGAGLGGGAQGQT